MIMHRTILIPLATALFAFGTPSAPAAHPSSYEAALVEALGGKPILEASPDELDRALAVTVRQVPKAAPQLLSTALKSRTDADALSPNLTATTLRAVSDTASDTEVGRILFAAVEATPDAVIDICKTCAPIPPRDSSMDEFVAGAVAALPDPYKEVMYQRGAKPKAAVSEIVLETRDYKGGDSKTVRTYKDPKDPYVPGEPMPLVQAVPLAVWEGRQGLDLDLLVSSADDAVRFGVSSLFTAVSSARTISGVGITGLPNYSNEPFLPTPTPTPKVDKTPKSDPVSR